MLYKYLFEGFRYTYTSPASFPIAFYQPLHMPVCWFGQFVSLIYTDKFTVRGQNLYYTPEEVIRGVSYVEK